MKTINDLAKGLRLAVENTVSDTAGLVVDGIDNFRLLVYQTYQLTMSLLAQPVARLLVVYVVLLLLVLFV